MNPTAKPTKKPPGLSRRNIESIVQLEQEFMRARTRLDRISDAVSNFVGSIYSLVMHAALIVTWITINTYFSFWRFDSYPYNLLSLVLAVETVFLSAFVLMSQNRQSRQADRWSHLDLQIGLLAEQESTKMLQLLQKICDKLGMPQVAADRELKEMVQTTHVEVLVDQLDQARESDSEEQA